jgi:hypothetical protein
VQDIEIANIKEEIKQEETENETWY